MQETKLCRQRYDLKLVYDLINVDECTNVTTALLETIVFAFSVHASKILAEALELPLN